MFRIYADNTLIYDSSLDLYTIAKGQIEREVNRSGKFVFTLYSDHPHIDQLQELKTIIRVYRDNTLIFRGRILYYVDGFYKDRSFTCEGELSFLVDSVQRPYNFQGSPSTLFTRFIELHNAQVDETKRFRVGQVTVEDPNNYINRENGSYEDTLTNLTDRLVGSLGGYIVMTDGPNNTRVINWLAEYGEVSSQTIEFGENLLDFARTRSAETIATALIPLGAQNEETGTRLTITSVNDNKDYIYDEAAVNRYGWIWRSETWDDVTVAANLLTKARARLAELSSLITSIELTAIDLSDLDKNIDAFSLGDYVRVKSYPHNLDAVYMLTKQTVDILVPENNKITLGYTFSGFVDKTLTNSALYSRIDAMASKGSIAAVRENIETINGALIVIEGTTWTPMELDAAFTASETVQYRAANSQVFVTGAVSPVTAYTSSDTEVVIATGIEEAYRPTADVPVILPGDGLDTFVVTVKTDGSLTISKYQTGQAYGQMDPSKTYSIHFSYSI